MSGVRAALGHDIWAQWILERRDAGLSDGALAHLAPVRQAVLAGAALVEGDFLVDVGCGDGLIGLAALPEVGDGGRVAFVDVSPAVLAACREEVERIELAGHAEFVEGSAEDLAGLSDDAADALTTRSVLIYVADLPAAFGAFRRVLKPGGRISIWEPINAHGHPEPEQRLLGYDVTPVRRHAERVRAVYDERQPPETDTMMSFDEQDLLRHAQDAGFVDLCLAFQLHDRSPAPVDDWEAFLLSAPNPRSPTLREAVDVSLTQVEAAEFLTYLRPLAERGEGRYRHAAAHLVGRKP